MKTDAAAPASILLVDDNTHGLTARGLILQELGHSIVTATSAEQGWELFQQTSFDLVVTDYRMGKMNGLEFIKAVRADRAYERVVVMMVTSESEPAHIARALMAGADEYAIKPMTSDGLRQKLQLVGLSQPA